MSTMKNFARWIVVAFALILAYATFDWTVNRVYVPEGKSLWVQYKGSLLGLSKEAEPGQFARYDQGEKGVLPNLYGPGRHFFCPIWWKTELVDDVVIEPGQVALVTSKLGNDLKGNEFLVDGDLGKTQFKGTLRKAFGPGRYRYHPYAYEFTTIKLQERRDGDQIKTSGWVKIPTGYVGVVTNLTEIPATGATAGVQDKVLQPGIYPINPKEQEVDIIEIGYREKSVQVDLRRDKDGAPVLDEGGEPIVLTTASGINFPSNDGFNINMDFTAIWGIMPEQAPKTVRQFGNVLAVENKFVVPQIESICRNLGSTKGAVELLVGESRQQFQLDTSKFFEKVLKEKDVTLLYGLVRHIYIPSEVRIPIQNANIADEQKLTRDQEQITAKTEAELRESESKVVLETERVRVETEKLVAQAIAEGQKKAEETKAETVQLSAAIDKQTAATEAQTLVLLGQARSSAERLLQEAKADKFQQAVKAFGTGEAYNLWVFANGLPDDIQLNLMFAGQGTLWTDLHNYLPMIFNRPPTAPATTPAPAKK